MTRSKSSSLLRKIEREQKPSKDRSRLFETRPDDMLTWCYTIRLRKSQQKRLDEMNILPGCKEALIAGT